MPQQRKSIAKSIRKDKRAISLELSTSTESSETDYSETTCSDNSSEISSSSSDSSDSSSEDSDRPAQFDLPTFLAGLPATDPRQMLVKNINAKYGWALFGGYRVPMCKASGYLNLSVICDHFKADLDSYLGEEETKWLLLVTKHKLRKEGQKRPLITPMECSGIDSVLGIYGHPIIATDLASACSPSFSVQVRSAALAATLAPKKSQPKASSSKKPALSSSKPRLSTKAPLMRSILPATPKAKKRSASAKPETKKEPLPTKTRAKKTVPAPKSNRWDTDVAFAEIMDRLDLIAEQQEEIQDQLDLIQRQIKAIHRQLD